MFNGASPRRVEVDAVGLCRDGDERRRLRLAPRRVGLVDVGGAGEPGDRDGADIGDREVGVQRLLEGDRMRRAVLHGETQRQGPRESYGVDRAKRLRPERRANVTVAETEGQAQRLSADDSDAVEMPRRGARKPVLRRRRRVPVGAEPREDDRDAAADRPARRKNAVGAGEEDRPCARRPPRGQMRSLQVKLARHTVERDRSPYQPVFRFDEIENAGNAEFGGELRGLYRSFPLPRDHHRRSRCSSAIKKIGTPVSEVAAAGGDVGACRSLQRRGDLQLRAPDNWGAALGPTVRHCFYSRRACDGRWRADLGWRVVWQGGRGEARGRGVGSSPTR